MSDSKNIDKICKKASVGEAIQVRKKKSKYKKHSMIVTKRKKEVMEHIICIFHNIPQIEKIGILGKTVCQLG